MTDFWMAYVTAFALGAGHALEVDHMVAVSAFVGGRPRWRSAVGFGLRWALGHSLVVLLAGLALATSGLRVPPGALRWAELGVGLMLLALGLWAWRAARRLHLHPPQEHEGHAHLHAHREGARPHGHAHDRSAAATARHRHLPTAVGALHGLAGTAPVVGLIPVTLLPDRAAALGYLAAFGAGTAVAMAGYAALAALAISRVAASTRWARGAAAATAATSFGVGVWWVLRALLAGSGS
jgi:nickel/cobalt exporter